MSLADLDPLLNGPKRLAIVGALANSKKIEFSFLSDHLGLSASDLSKQMSALTNQGYVSAKKVGKGRNRTTWYRVTEQGRSALNSHVAALNALATTSIQTSDTADA